jgi:hypothetical protein
VAGLLIDLDLKIADPYWGNTLKMPQKAQK